MFLINGQVFIKKNPETKKDLVLEDGAELRIILSDGAELTNGEDDVLGLFNSMINLLIEANALKKVDDKSYLMGDKILPRDKIMDVFKEFFMEKGIIREEEHTDYFKNRGFYQVNIGINGIVLINKAIDVSIKIDDFDKFNDDYLSLDEYFKKALFIGRETVINGYPVVILYESYGIYIVSCNNYYLVINKNDLLVDSITFGSMISEYIDKDTLYRAIINQEFINKRNDNNDGKLRRK